MFGGAVQTSSRKRELLPFSAFLRGLREKEQFDFRGGLWVWRGEQRRKNKSFVAVFENPRTLSRKSKLGRSLTRFNSFAHWANNAETPTIWILALLFAFFLLLFSMSRSVIFGALLLLATFLLSRSQIFFFSFLGGGLKYTSFCIPYAHGSSFLLFFVPGRWRMRRTKEDGFVRLHCLPRRRRKLKIETRLEAEATLDPG